MRVGISIRTFLLASIATGALSATIAETQAGGFAVREQSAVGQGSSFAGAGTPGMGLSSMYWNPAAITQATGWWSESHLAIIAPQSDLTALPGTSPGLLALGPNAGNVGATGVIPASYAAYRLNSNFVIGYSINSPFGLATHTILPWAGQQLGTRASVRSIDFAPILGWQVNNWLSIGAGPRVMWLQGKFNRAILPSTAAPAVTMLDVDDIGFGFAAGITLTPWGGTEISLGYRSAVKFSLDGDAQLPVLGLLGPLSGGTFNISGDVKTPDQATLGIRHRVGPQLTLLGTVEWSNWSNVQTIPFVFQNGPGVNTTATTLTFNYRDGWFYSVGAEYELTPQHTIRAGIAYEVSPVRDEVRDPILPDNNRWWFSAGLTTKLVDWATLDFGYSFIWVGDTPITVGPGHPDVGLLLGTGGPLLATSDPYIHIFAASLRFKWTAEPKRVITKG